MRRGLILLAPLLLAGCVDDSATYYIDGSDHAITVRAEQQYFWDDEVALKLVAVHWPECQRQYPLVKVAPGDLKAELYSGGEQVYILRVGTHAWQVDGGSCAQQPVAAAQQGERLGTFQFNAENKFVFEKAVGGGMAAQ